MFCFILVGVSRVLSSALTSLQSILYMTPFKSVWVIEHIGMNHCTEDCTFNWIDTQINKNTHTQRLITSRGTCTYCETEAVTVYAYVGLLKYSGDDEGKYLIVGTPDSVTRPTWTPGDNECVCHLAGQIQWQDSTPQIWEHDEGQTYRRRGHCGICGATLHDIWEFDGVRSVNYGNRLN